MRGVKKKTGHCKSQKTEIGNSKCKNKINKKNKKKKIKLLRKKKHLHLNRLISKIRRGKGIIFTIKNTKLKKLINY